jgi:predicted transcriptional regulator
MRPSRNQALIEALGDEIRTRRKELELTQEDLAGRCEIDRPFISLMEVGRKQPTISVMYRVASALELRFAEFCDRVDNRYRRRLRRGEKARQ